MKFSKIFSNNNPVAGLEISDTAIRLALLARDNQAAIIEVEQLAEEILPQGVVMEGAVADQKKLIEALKNLRGKLKTNIRFAIVSIPGNNIYSRIYSIPKTIGGEKLAETMRLTASFQLPQKPETVYAGWQVVQSEIHTDCLLAMAPRHVIDALLGALREAKFHPVALEYDALSLGRILAFGPNERILIQIPNNVTAGLFVFKNGVPRFGRTVAVTPKIGDEISKVNNFYESEDGAITASMTLEKTKILDVLSRYPEIKQSRGSWHIALGSAMRGLLERKDDTGLSLMPIGTKEAYEFQQASSFADMLTHTLIGLGLFFVATYIGAWLFISSMHGQLAATGDTSIHSTAGTTGGQVEQSVRELNSLITLTSSILGNDDHWSEALREIHDIADTDITILSINQSGPPNNSVLLSGTALDRNSLNAFKKRLEESKLFTKIVMPLTNLEQKKDIPFSISLSVAETLETNP